VAELEEWTRLADEQGDIGQQLDARQYLAEVYEQQGRVAEALAVLKAAMEIARMAGSVAAERRLGEALSRLEALARASCT
jgi:tetratricopeptide (TPR) repeat protein